MRPDEAEMGATILKYGHFCELIPEVRREHYRVEKTKDGFVLHRSAESAHAEEQDVLMTELSLPFEVRRGPDHRRELIRTVSPWSNTTLDDLIKYVKESCGHYGNQIKESFLLPPDAFRNCFGFTPDDLRKTRAAMMAVADIAIAMSFATQEKAKSAQGPLSEYLFKKSLSWANPVIERDFIVHYLTKLVDLDEGAASAVLSAFSNRMDDTDFGAAGDGYLPPFVEADNSLLFNPYVVRFMLHQRNLLYVLNKRHRKKFDEIASPALEPQLLLEAEAILQKLPGTLIVKNVEWREGELRGEIDLLVYEPTSLAALQVQAKAALPPQGARMTRRVEDQTRKAVAQLTAFRDLPALARDRICSEALGTAATVSTWTSVALSRSGFGAVGGWQVLQGVLPMNVQLIAETVQEILHTPGASLEGFEDTARRLWADLCAKCLIGWEVETINILGTVIELPLLKLNYDQINKAKIDLERASAP
jgi:hypothetical protein